MDVWAPFSLTKGKINIDLLEISAHQVFEKFLRSSFFTSSSLGIFYRHSFFSSPSICIVSLVQEFLRSLFFTSSRMNRLQGASSVKRKQPELPAVSDSLTGNDLVLYNLIHSKKDMAIWIADMRKETNLSHSDVEKSLQSLVSKTLIEQVVNIHNKGRKHYMATEFKPSNEITGGDWYNKKGSFDTGFINLLQDKCFRYIFNQKVSTLDGVLEWSRSGVFSTQVKTEQIQEILKTLLLDDKIVEVTSTGSGDFASIPKGRICYKCKSKGGVIEEQKHAAFTDIPCGVCSRINVCTIDGIVSPTTCVYYQKWLDF